LRKRVYGPVMSRRYGLSLGVDPVASKSCTYDCVYCQLGPTPRTTTERAEFHPLAEVLLDVREAMARGPSPDVITVAGSGEPTLYSRLGDLARGLAAVARVPRLLITNGSLLWREDVARDARQFDIVAPTLTSTRESVFRGIVGPSFPASAREVVDGIESFARSFQGRLHLEVFLVRGVNDDEESLADIVAAVERIGPSRVDINTAVRPVPSRPGVEGVGYEVLERLARRLPCPASPVPAAPVARTAVPVDAAASLSGLAARVLDTVARRPSTLEDLASALGVEPAEVGNAADALVREGRLAESLKEQRSYYVLPTAGSN